MKLFLKYTLLLVCLVSITAGTAFAYILKDDPYENAWDDTHVKLYYLKRITNSMENNDPPFLFEKDEVFERKRFLGCFHEGLYAPWSTNTVNNDGTESQWLNWSSSRIIYAVDSIDPNPKLRGKYYIPPGTPSRYPQGAVYITNRPEDLTPLFAKVAKKIKTRLVK